MFVWLLTTANFGFKTTLRDAARIVSTRTQISEVGPVVFIGLSHLRFNSSAESPPFTAHLDCCGQPGPDASGVTRKDSCHACYDAAGLKPTMLRSTQTHSILWATAVRWQEPLWLSPVQHVGSSVYRKNYVCVHTYDHLSLFCTACSGLPLLGSSRVHTSSHGSCRHGTLLPHPAHPGSDSIADNRLPVPPLPFQERQ